jgi:regulator of CtrA degradation
MRPIPVHEDGDSQLLFLPGVFNETLALLFDAHHYFQANGAKDQSQISSKGRALYASEMTRITMRLTSVMAWIMVRRAIHAGRIEQEKASSEYRLEASDICGSHDAATLAKLPNYMIYLSEQSLSLYERVFRLDELAYGTRQKKRA